MKALIVDSSKSFQNILASVIEDAGFEVVTAVSGAEARKRLAGLKVDLVCTSMLLEDMDAFMFCSYLRGMPETGHLPIILVTSSDDKNSMIKVISVGVTEVFTKYELDKISNYVSQLVI